jgi:flagellar hook-associated protein 3 FlgL
MSTTSFGDLARNFIGRYQNTALKAELFQRSDELGTGRKADTGKIVAGDFSALTGLEHTLRKIEAYKLTASELGFFAGSMQESLSKVQTLAGDLGPSLTTAGGSSSTIMINSTAAEAARTFSAIVDSLNVSVGGRRIFAGAATDTKPLISSEDMIADINLVIAGETTAAGIVTALDTWFDDPGGGFALVAYQGAATDLGPFRIGEETDASLDVRADDPAIREVLKGLTMAALIPEGTHALDESEMATLSRLAGEQIMSSEAGFAVLRAKVGSAEALIDSTATQNTATATTIEASRNEILAADPYEAATRLEAVQLQLEALYTVTARLSRLSLSEYLR